jgi:hypothetical protein
LDNKKKNYLDGLRYTVKLFTDAGHRVHVVLPPPGFPSTLNGNNAWYPSQCNTLQVLTDIASCGETRSEDEVIAEISTLYSEVTASVGAAGGSTIDYRAEVCSSDECSTNVNNFWRYLDGTHISVGLSEELTPLMVSHLQQQSYR